MSILASLMTENGTPKFGLPGIHCMPKNE